MKQVMMYVSNEFHEMLATHMIGDEVQISGMDFYFDSFRTEPLYSESEGEDIPVLTCNAAFRAMTVGKGHFATEHIKDSDLLSAELKASMQERAERVAEAQGWSFCEGAGLALRNINGEIVPCNEETRRILRTTTVSELLDGKKRGLTQKDYDDAEQHFETKTDTK
jgi:hypothetical protein